MSGQQNDDNIEILFSFEFMVECVRIEEHSKVSDELALGVRLLDFPTLLIYRPQRSSDITPRDHRGQYHKGEHVFNRGKCCFFKMNMNSLHAQLLNGPLYAMVLDVKEEIPKLVGTSLISLSNVMDRIRKDVTEHGAATPSAHGERGFTALCNVTGERIGSISLSYKLLSLGASVLPLIKDSKNTRVNGEQRGREKNESTVPLECGTVSSSMLKSDVRRNNPSNYSNLIPDDKQDSDVSVTIKTVHKPRTQIPQPSKYENSFEDDLTTGIFCPPRLFYSNSEKEKCKNEAGDWKQLNPDSETFACEDAQSEEEMSEINTESMSPPFMNQTVKDDVMANQPTSGVTPNVLGEALQHLPLLNALLVELSQLTGQNPRQPPSVHPNPSWIYRLPSPAPLTGHGNPQKNHGSCPHLKNMHPTRKCSTPVLRPSSAKERDKQEEACIQSTSHRKKFTYGTTKTFNLRLKLLSSHKDERECRKLIQNKKQENLVKGKPMANNKKMSNGRKSGLNQSTFPNENIEEVTEGIKADSTLQATITLKKETLNEEIHGKQHGYAARIADNFPLSERHCELIHIPCVDGDSVVKNQDKSEDLRKSNQPESRSDRHGDKFVSSGSSRHSSSKSSLSESGKEDKEKGDYTDDFNSLESSDAFSPDPVSSPEPSRTRTPKSPVHLDFYNAGSDSDVFKKRAVLPQPTKASPQHALGDTYTIRPQSHASALSFSSHDSDSDGSASLQTTCSRKQSESQRTINNFGTDTLLSSQGQSSKSTKDNGSGQGISVELMSSIESQDIEELEDELGSLDFRNKYQHISKLVASKVPGYTI